MDRVFEHRLLADTLGGLFQFRAKHSTDVVGFRFGDEAFTYGQMRSMVNRLCASFKRDGIQPGERIAVYMYNSPWMLATYLACAVGGLVFCPLNPLLRKADLGYILEDLRPSVLFLDDELLPIVEEVSSPDSIVASVVFGAAGSGWRGHAASSAWIEQRETDLDVPEVRPGEPLCIMYSGGTTGLPKGVILPQFAPVAAALRMNEIANFEARSVYFSVLQLSHGWTPLIALPFCLYFGHLFCFWRWWSASRFVSALKAYGASITDPFVGMIAMLLRTPMDVKGQVLKGVRVIGGIGGSDPVSLKHRAEFETRFGAKVFDLYGLTEITGLVATEREGDALRTGSSGKIGRWYDVAIVDQNDLAVPNNSIGEIVIRPKVPFTTALGYHNKEELTVEAWRNLWIHTGDTGFIDVDGYLFFVGRKGNFLRRRGELISVAEIESVIMTFPDVVEVAVVAAASELGEDELRAFVVSRDTQFDPGALLAYCGDRLARFKVPRYVDRIDELPRTGTKREIERFRLREFDLGGAWDREKARTPAS